MAAASVLQPVPEGRSSRSSRPKNTANTIFQTPTPHDSVSCVGRRRTKSPPTVTQQQRQTPSRNRKREPRDPSTATTTNSAFSSYQTPGSIASATLFSTYTNRSPEPVPFQAGSFNTTTNERFVQIPALTSSAVERNDADADENETEFGELSEFYTAEEDEVQEVPDGGDEEEEQEGTDTESTEEVVQEDDDDDDEEDDDEEEQEDEEAWDEENSDDDDNERSNSGW